MGDPPGDACVYPASQPAAIITADCIKLRVDRRLGDPKFFAYAVPSRVVHPQILEITRGVAQMKVSLGRFGRIRLPLAPLNEQRRIVAKIEELFSDLDAGVAALERAKAKLAWYRASVLKSAVEGRLTERWRAENPSAEPASELLARILTERRRRWEEEQRARYAEKGKEPPKGWREKYREPEGPDVEGLPTLPEGWCWASVAQLGEAVTGTTPSTSNRAFYGGDLPFVKPTDLNRGYYVTSATDTLSETGAAVARLLPEMSVLVTCIGATIGKTGLARSACVTNQQINAIVPFAGVDPEWLYWVFVSPFGQTSVISNASATTLPILNKGKFELLPVPLPPAQEQRTIVSILEERFSVVEKTESLVRTDVSRAARLRQSILRCAFEGRLVPQDPTDEPADVLLARIKAERDAATATNGKPKRRRKIKT